MSGKNKLKVTCYVRVDPNSTVTEVLDKLWEDVIKKMKKEHHTKVSIQNENEEKSDKTAITLIICPVSSRLASNAKHAMKDIEGHENMALVFLHHSAKHVPFNCDSKSMLVDVEYKSLGAMIDVVFFEGEGIYDCPANTRAMQKLCEFLKGRSTKKKNNEDKNGANRKEDSKVNPQVDGRSTQEKPKQTPVSQTQYPPSRPDAPVVTQQPKPNTESRTVKQVNKISTPDSSGCCTLL